jgi:hypothetical protein
MLQLQDIARSHASHGLFVSAIKSKRIASDISSLHSKLDKAFAKFNVCSLAHRDRGLNSVSLCTSLRVLSRPQNINTLHRSRTPESSRLTARKNSSWTLFLTYVHCTFSSKLRTAELWFNMLSRRLNNTWTNRWSHQIPLRQGRNLLPKAWIRGI